MTYEIVGLYDFQFKFPYTCVRNQFYVPASTVPETFENGMGIHINSSDFCYFGAI